MYSTPSSSVGGWEELLIIQGKKYEKNMDNFKEEKKKNEHKSSKMGRHIENKCLSH